MTEPAHQPEAIRRRRTCASNLSALVLVFVAASIAVGAVPARAQTHGGTGGTALNPADPAASPPTQPGSVGLVILVICMLVIAAGGAALVLRYKGTGPGSSG